MRAKIVEFEKIREIFFGNGGIGSVVISGTVVYLGKEKQCTGPEDKSMIKGFNCLFATQNLSPCFIL